MLFKQKQKVLCIGSAGKDIFFPVEMNCNSSLQQPIKKVENNNISQLCFQLGSKMHVKDRFVAMGGCACNVSVGLSRLGVSTAVFGIVGNDSDGEYIKKSLSDEKVNVKNLLVDKKSNTDISVIIVDSKSGERTIFVNRDVGEKLKINPAIFKNHEWVYVGSLYGNDLNDNIETIHEEIKNNSGLKLAYNPGGSNINNNPKEVHSLLHHASLIFVNKSEAEQVAKILKTDVSEDILSSEEKLIKFIYESVKDAIVVLTNGKKGAWGYTGDKIYHEKASEEKALDTTGAGDSFTSGFFAAIIHGHDIEIAMKWGVKNSYSVIKYYGAIEGLLKLENLK